MSHGTSDAAHEMRALWHAILRLFDRYHPERHYMRGHGPKSMMRPGTFTHAGELRLIPVRAQPRHRAR